MVSWSEASCYKTPQSSDWSECKLLYDRVRWTQWPRRNTCK